MAIALRGGPPHRASGALALHVLEAMHGVLQAAEDGRFVELQTKHVERAFVTHG
jgi:hypothetical protein